LSAGIADQTEVGGKSFPPLKKTTIMSVEIKGGAKLERSLLLSGQRKEGIYAKE